MVKKKKKDKIKEKSVKTFYKKIVAAIKRKPWLYGSIAVTVIIVLVLVGRSISSRKNGNENLQTSVVERGDLIAIVGATGVVKPNQSVQLTWETTGRVEKVDASITQVVESGDVLAQLADNTLPQSVILAKADLVAAKRALEDLLNSTTESSLAYTNLLEAESELSESEEERDDWNYNEADIDRVFEARAEFLEAEETFKSVQNAFNLVADLDELDEKRIQAQEKLDAAQLERDKTLRNLNYILGKSYDRQVAADFADYDVAASKLQDAQREWERVKDGPNADDIIAAEARVAAAEATVSLSWIEAPFSGTITDALPKVGDEVSMGENAFRIDDLSELFVEVEISEVDINRIKVEQKAKLSFDAILGDDFTAEVTEVSSVGMDRGSGVDFMVTLKILDATDQVRPGMTAAVNIIVSEIDDVIYVPNRAVRLMEYQRVVFLLKNNELVEVPVEFGASSDINSEVVSGEINEGDLIVLNPPMEFLTAGEPPAFVR